MPLPENGFGLMPVVDVAPPLLNTFRCGKPHLDAFLVSSAFDRHRARVSLTTVVFHQDFPDQIIGYFTLANDALPLKTSEQEELGLSEVDDIKAFPAVKLGRLAVAEAFQRQRVGEQIMGFVHGEILDSASLSAARLVTLDADNDSSVIRFYEKLGYQSSLWAEAQRAKVDSTKRGTAPQTIKMIRDILA